MAHDFEDEQTAVTESTESAEATAEANEETGDAGSTEAATTEAAEDTTEQDWAAFEAAVQGALTHEARDAGTGEIPGHVASGVLPAYRALKGTKQRKQAMKHLHDGMSNGLTSGDFTVARTLLIVLQAIEEGGGSTRDTAPKTPVDPTEALVSAVAALMLAPNLVSVPEGVAADWAAKANEKAQELGSQVIAYRDWKAANEGKAEEERSAAPEVDDIVLLAAKIAGGRSVNTRKASGTPRAAGTGSDGPRRDIAAHIREAVAGKAAGTYLSVGDLVKFKSTEYGDAEPSPGAIAARLFPKGDASKCNLDFVTPVSEPKKGVIVK